MEIVFLKVQQNYLLSLSMLDISKGRSQGGAVAETVDVCRPAIVAADVTRRSYRSLAQYAGRAQPTIFTLGRETTGS